MKHSKQIALVLLGTVSAISLAACSSNTDDAPKDGTPIYEKVEDCKAINARDCEDGYRYALANHINRTQKQYKNEEECKVAHDRCMDLSPNGNSIWLPAMIGYILGSNIANSRPVYLQANGEDKNKDRQVVAGGHSSSVHPIIIGSYGGGSYTPGGLSTGMSSSAARLTSTGVSTGATPSSTPRAVVSTAARGGFGSTGSGHAVSS
jgi:uncharacterized protein YgiB involved in biofilm formation